MATVRFKPNNLFLHMVASLHHLSPTNFFRLGNFVFMAYFISTQHHTNSVIPYNELI